MAATGLPRTTRTDLARVTESLDMLAPRWSVWTLMTLAEQPLRYMEIRSQLSWLHSGQLNPRLRKLTDSGLIQRTEHGPRHVTYSLTARATELLPALTVIAAWGDEHLEKELVRNARTGEMEPERIPAAQNAEDTIVLISPRHTTPILWALKARGAASAKALAAEAMPTYGLPAVYLPLDRLVADGLVVNRSTATGVGEYQLSATGRALAPVFQSLSAWAAGRPIETAGAHPLWGQAPASAQTRSGPWLTTQTRLPAPAAPTAPTAAPAWRGGDLFSHQTPARPLTVSPAGGPRR
ncbi:winged helix-turn-helix transcriptional regulator [Streptomyces sp. DG2A-72]|uniref:winged helix-turn-helix transcriptional regulator n=1 Tax=Streptomyces sp. DG2A-72 TaxID=3051386 RepID=UPI00265BA426|nr:winged helix-turn-helix transcriptional regulator [Streptomyces sp. DG2A-72]MDO0936465.1 winged helix-turn-helix transcriptional regulator [Streptomyces sp. DG2A-72]